MAFIRIMSTVALLLGLAACGGGSGGSSQPQGQEPYTPEPPSGDPAPNSVYGVPAVGGFEPTVTHTGFGGARSRAELTHENALHFMSGFYWLLDAAYGVGSDIDYYTQPGALGRGDGNDVGTGTDVDRPSCQTGSIDERTYEYDLREITVVTYDQCQIDDSGMATGQLIFDASFNTDGELSWIDTYYRDMAFVAGEESVVVHGQVRLDQDKIEARELTVSNSVTETQTHTVDLTIQTSGRVEGRVYHSDWGFVTLTSDYRGDEVTMAGDSDARQSVESVGSNSLLDMTFQRSSGEELQTRMTVSEAMAWSSQNRPPEVNIEQPLIVEREHFVEIHTESIDDPDRDYLAEEWEYRDRPSGCEGELHGPSENSVPSFTAPCKGTHTIALIVKDGAHTVTRELAIEVVPPVAELVTDTVKLDATENGLSAQVQPLRPDADGPFSYRIAHGPDAFSIDQNGTLTLDGDINRDFSGGLVHVGVEVDNGRPELHDVAVIMPASDDSVSGFHHSELSGEVPHEWTDLDEDGKPDFITEWGNTFALVEATEQGLVHDHLEMREFSAYQRLALAVFDADGDGAEEILLVYRDRYVLLSGEDFSIKESTPFDMGGSVDASAVSAHIYEGNEPGLLLKWVSDVDEWGRPGTTEWFAYDLTTDTYFTAPEPSVNPATTQSYDFTGEGREHLLMGSEGSMRYLRSFSGEERSFGYENIRAADVNADGTDELVYISLPSWSGASGYMHSYSPDAELADSSPSLDLPSDWIEQDVHGYAFVNLDDEVGDELVFQKASFNKELHIYKWSGEAYAHVETQTLPKLSSMDAAPLNPRVAQYDEQVAAVVADRHGGYYRIGLGETPAYVPAAMVRYKTPEREVAPPYVLGTESTGNLSLFVRDSGGASSPDRPGVLELDADLNPVSERWFDDWPDYTGAQGLQRFESASGADQVVYPIESYPSTNFVVADPTENSVEPHTYYPDEDQLVFADLDQDGAPERYTVGGRSLTAGLPYGGGTEQVDYEEEIYDSGFYEFDSIVLDQGERPTLYIYREDVPDSGADPLIIAYQYRDGQVVRVDETRVEYRAHDPRLSQQDTDGDGEAELIFWNDSLSHVVILNSELEELDRYNKAYDGEAGVQYLIPDLPDIQSSGLVYAAPDESGGKPEGTRLIKYDLSKDRVIEQSRYYPGRLPQGGLLCQGDDLASCTRTLTTTEGVFRE